MTKIEPVRWLVTGARVVSPDEADYVRKTLTAYHERLTFNTFDSQPLTIVHGGCSTGVDPIAEQWAIDAHDVTSEGYPADWSRLGRSAGPVRNAYMVSLGADMCLAFPVAGSRGTWDCLQKAVNAGIPSHLHQLNTRRKEQS